MPVFKLSLLFFIYVQEPERPFMLHGLCKLPFHLIRRGTLSSGILKYMRFIKAYALYKSHRFLKLPCRLPGKARNDIRGYRGISEIPA